MATASLPEGPGVVFTTPYGTSYHFEPHLISRGKSWPDWVSDTVNDMPWYDRLVLTEIVNRLFDALNLPGVK